MTMIQKTDRSQSVAAGQPGVAFVTMGCAKNEADTMHMRARLSAAGFDLIDDPAEADAVVVNTCSFIRAATEESLEAIFDAAQLPKVASGDAKLIVAGCMPARYGEDLAQELTEARAFVPCSREDDIVSVLSSVLGVDAREAKPAAETSPTSAYVKISDGCDRFCSFCTIPLIRGRYHSFSFEDIRSEIASLVSGGTREIVLIAQDTGRWGTDFDEPSSLADLVATLAAEFRDTWFRIMYLQPEGVTDEYLSVVAGNENVCSYFDIPLQHVDPALLRSMNRSGSGESFDTLVRRIRAAVPDATLRTTLIAGYPGETDSQFEDLCAFVEDSDFDYIGVFAYSREEGTRAFDFPDQIDEDEKAYRAQRLRDVADAVCIPRIAARVGREIDVLVEGMEEDGHLFGRAMSQAPDADGVTYLESGSIGQIRRVTIEDTLLYEMEGA